ncbi:uncharacterized protein A4U43_C05F20730 [Asparagus officinalis]|uniref:Cellulose synthase n=1 Tax=Asparagus officinalis TaxID=4686 RepID=A0A5P1ETV3_ASPOF|nr:uncharacterized protein A4U43_C05F20730 [Asparagus officinalis]
MSSPNPNLPTLNTLKPDPLTPFNRLHLLLYSFSLLLLFYHHLTSSSPLLLILSDLILAFQWAFTQAFRWRPIRRREFPDRIPDDNLPSLDVFICTADPWKEPPMTVVNTALSVMAYEYPPDKISVYVSDDGGSDLTLFAFMEAAKFARYWLPFCTENGIVERAPEAYFGSNSVSGSGSDEEIKVRVCSLVAVQL